MDSSVDPAIREAQLRAEIHALQQRVADLSLEVTALKGVAGIEAAEKKRLERMLQEATRGMSARGKGSASTRAVDKP